MCASGETVVASPMSGALSVEEAGKLLENFHWDMVGLFDYNPDGSSYDIRYHGFGAFLTGRVTEYDPDELHASYPVRVLVDERLSPDVALVLLRKLVRMLETRYGSSAPAADPDDIPF